ncbi:MAG: hypothetical protein ICV69_07910 [Thermoleophilaceae bacterium]|nr:hypothetical protein [Thermoleophilaceae bacterium]
MIGDSDLHRVVIDVRRAEGHVGSLPGRGQDQPQPFSGWLALLETARSPAGRTPKPTQEENR